MDLILVVMLLANLPRSIGHGTVDNSRSTAQDCVISSTTAATAAVVGCQEGVGGGTGWIP